MISLFNLSYFIEIGILNFNVFYFLLRSFKQNSLYFFKMLGLLVIGLGDYLVLQIPIYFKY